ncbi:xanthine dehydrogenase 1-like isoform X3 [Cucumis melo var. makuwa]|uniref:Xanthine dehydrogenase 1-like isoform X3 n=1 Tax=Cucumis melo var. makuwa TaxID=1194695 RepID=A0A5A7VJ20_CUCMM|nr:xanthine dehydrogenase 1-like isoform X3 [Cucumis melo var. makuwa]TYK00933.1 xanthine dehydrogenase 1-like isoform X3 [Cucumis melo var. makuwa]
MSKVVCKTKRIGGGFGGKETRAVVYVAAASVPSFLLNQPVKLTLDRDTDMMITGQQHNFLGKYKGKVCFTNFPSNTAFRGFGGPQGMLITENWIQRIAVELKKTPEEIRDQLKTSCDFANARKEVEQFNSQNRWKKHGVAMVPTKFGISFTLKLMNQAGALVHVYTDGTILVTHGGVEMGQGLHTKVAQVAASAFNIPLSSEIYL